MMRNKLILLLFLFAPVTSFGQHLFKGIVRDALTQEALPGVVVVIEGHEAETYTNRNGEFKIESKRDTIQAIFSYLGYKTISVSITSSAHAVIELKEDSDFPAEKDYYIKNSLDLGYYADLKQAPYGVIANYSLQKLGRLNVEFNTVFKYWKEGQNKGYDFSISKSFNSKISYLPDNILLSYKSISYQEKAFDFTQTRALVVNELPALFAVDIGGAYNVLSQHRELVSETARYYSAVVGVTKIFSGFSPLKNWGLYSNINYNPNYTFYEAGTYKGFSFGKFPQFIIMGKYYHYGDQEGFMVSLRLKVLNTRSYCCHSWTPYYDYINALK